MTVRLTTDPSRWPKHLTFASIAAALLLLGCLAVAGLITARVAANPATLPPIDLKLANVELWIGVANNPDCPPMVVGCLITPSPNQLVLSGWWAVTAYQPGRFTVDARPLVRLRLR